MILEAIERGWENFLTRPQGSFGLRFFLQPAIGAIIAFKAGMRDRQEGRAAYLWQAYRHPDQRAALLREGWKDVRNIVLSSTVLDIVYQVMTHRFVYPLELLFTATLLALLPYFLLRGPFNRLARLFPRGEGKGP